MPHESNPDKTLSTADAAQLAFIGGDTEALAADAVGRAGLDKTSDPLAPDSTDTRAEDCGSDDVPPDVSYLQPSDHPGSLGKLSHYEILEVLGQGAFGTVFRAQDETLQRVVAVKVLAPAMASVGAARLRFLREARLSAAVRHESVVHVFAVEEEPLPYLVMEYIAGETLQSRLDREGPLPLPDVLRIGRQLAEGLAAAHATGLIHRDIKPSNVMIGSDAQQRVKITDFGLARAADDASISQSGVVAGTPMYMAPEQAGADAIDHRADLFSLGSLLYALCTGRPPFRAGNTLAILKRVCEDTPRSMRDIIPELPEWLCRIVGKLHAKDPSDRFQTAEQLAKVLADCEAQCQTFGKLRDYSLIPGGKPPRYRSGWKWWTAASLLLVLPLLALGVYLMSRPDSPPKRDDGIIDISSVTASAINLPGLPPTSIETRKGDAQTGPSGCVPRVYSSDGKWLVTCGVADRTRVWEVATGKLRAEFPGQQILGNPAFSPEVFSPDGTLLAVTQTEKGLLNVALVDTSTFAVHRRLGVPGTELCGLAFSPDGKRLATSSAAVVVVWDTEQGEEVDRLVGFNQPQGIAFHPAGKMLAVLDRLSNYQKDRSDGMAWAQDARISLWDVDPQSATYKQELHQWDAPDNGYSNLVRFSLQGDRLLFCRGSGNELSVLIADVASRKIVQQLRSNTGRWGHIMLGNLMPDGKSLPLLVLYRPTAVVQIWDIDAGKLQRSFNVGDRMSFCDLAMDPTGSTLALGGQETQRLRFFHVAKGKEIRPGGPAARPAAADVVQRIASLSPEQQVLEVIAELQRRNPAFDGKHTSEIEEDRVIGLQLSGADVTDIGPVQALAKLQTFTCVGANGGRNGFSDLSPLRKLHLKSLSVQSNPQLSNLAPLRGMPLESLHLWGWSGSDLTPLQGMPLRWLNCGAGHGVTDLSPLAGAPLEFLCINITGVSDLTPLKDMPLTTLLCERNQVADLAPLRGLALKTLTISHTKVTDLAPLKGMPLTQLHFDGAPVTDLSPLKDLPLEIVRCDAKLPGLAAVLRSIATLHTINEMPAEQFLREITKE